MPDFSSPTDGGRGPGGAGGSRSVRFTYDAAESSPSPANGDGALIYPLNLDPSRSMRAITGEVEALLDGLEETQRRSGGLLAGELIAQVVGGRVSDWNGQRVGFTVQLREDAVRMEAMGPVAPRIDATTDHDVVPDDPIADWGTFIIDRLADRWGLDGGSQQMIWAEIETPA